MSERVTEIVKIAFGYRAKYGHVGRLWAGHKLIVFLGDAEDIEQVLNSHVHIQKAAEYQFFKPWLGDGLLISSGYFQTIFIRLFSTK